MVSLKKKTHVKSLKRIHSSLHSESKMYDHNRYNFLKVNHKCIKKKLLLLVSNKVFFI